MVTSGDAGLNAGRGGDGALGVEVGVYLLYSLFSITLTCLDSAGSSCMVYMVLKVLTLF